MKLALTLMTLVIMGQSVMAAPLCQVRSPAPPLTIVGEQHIDLQMKAIEKEDLEAAQMGKVIFAQEGWVSGHQADTDFWSTHLGLTTQQSVGVEEERSYSTGLMAVHLLDYHASLSTLAQAARTRDNATVAQALILTRQSRGQVMEGLSRYNFTKQLSDANAWPASSLAKQQSPTTVEELNSWINEELAWDKAFQDFVKRVADHLMQDMPVTGYDPQILVEGVAANANCTQSNRMFDELIIKWRNQFIGRHIAEAYCEAAKQGKGVTALLGARHLKGIRPILNGLLPNNVHVIERNLNELAAPVGCAETGDITGN